jgi:sterol desaturase/sphingolipid hydroxylase (fatty acid hydroxylase superfamily)
MNQEPLIRVAFFLALLALFGCWELLAPRRACRGSRPFRWAANLLLVIVDTLTLRAVAAVWTAGLAMGAALLAEEHAIGLHYALKVPYWPAAILSIVILDFVVYAQHVAFHKVPLFWRVHKVHHSDVGVDVSTALRFHPIEIFLSMQVKVAVILLFGMPALAVLIFEVLLNGMAMFNHANIRIPVKLDVVMRLLVVTPDMHRVHHSVHQDETDSNFGFNLSLWDRICRTYRPQPRDGHETMGIGLAAYQRPEEQNLAWILALPFRSQRPAPARERRH